MQVAEAQKGASTRSHLFDSLKVYLNNKTRLQPIIGLGSIIECVKAGTHNREALYLCEVCVCRLSNADIRNHIMGSLHRYNYIRAWHPYLVSEWKEDSDLSKQAWPLMEKAKILEGKEGPGDVQFLELEEAIYQKMAACSENDAVTLINILRDGQIQPDSHSGTTSVQLEEYPVQSQRIVLLAQNQQRRSERWLNKPSTSLSDSPETSLEPSVLSENKHSFLDSYKGTMPLIEDRYHPHVAGVCSCLASKSLHLETTPGQGLVQDTTPKNTECLFRVVECVSEDGYTYGFLCHCCRIRSKKRDIIDHLTSSSHLVNSLMETHPAQVEVMMADIKNNYQLLQSLAKKVEQVEGRGQLKVVNIPESLCMLLDGKSYHWCIKMLSKGWSHTNIQKRKTDVKGPSVNTTAKQGVPQSAVVLSEKAKRNTTMRKKRKARNTVFQVSLPISKGSVLLKRTSFSRQVSLACSPLSDADLSPESPWTEDSELDCDTGSFAVTHAEQTSQLQQDHYNGDGDAGQYMGPGHYQEVEGYYSDNEYNHFNQSEHVTEVKDPWFHGERNYNRECDSQERSNKRFGEEGQWQSEVPQTQSEGPQTQNECLSPAGSHPWHWSSCNASYRPEVGYPEQWYYSASQSEVGTGVTVSGEKRPKEMSSDATQYYHQQHPQDQYMTRDYASLTGSVGQPGEFAPHLDATRINMYPHVGDPFAPQSRVQLSETEHREWQAYRDFAIGHDQTAQQNDVMQPTAHQAIQVVYGVMSNTYDNTVSTENPDQYFPSVFWS